MTYTADTTNTADTIDSRDIIARYEELTGQDEIYSEDEYAEVKALIELIDEGEGLEDWEHGVLLVRDSYFIEYAQEFAEDIGAIESEARWPAYCIDWEQAARELQMDYTPVEFDGVTYWAR